MRNHRTSHMPVRQTHPRSKLCNYYIRWDLIEFWCVKYWASDEGLNVNRVQRNNVGPKPIISQIIRRPRLTRIVNHACSCKCFHVYSTMIVTCQMFVHVVKVVGVIAHMFLVKSRKILKQQPCCCMMFFKGTHFTFVILYECGSI